MRWGRDRPKVQGMTDGEQAKAPAGWYAHPEMANTQRYWDGQAWTDQVAPMPEHKPDTQSLELVGIFGGLLFPIVGLICALALFGKPNKGGVALFVLILSVASFYGWYYVLTSDNAI